jgi:hypothetical protein
MRMVIPALFGFLTTVAPPPAPCDLASVASLNGSHPLLPTKTLKLPPRLKVSLQIWLLGFLFPLQFAHAHNSPQVECCRFRVVQR